MEALQASQFGFHLNKPYFSPVYHLALYTMATLYVAAGLNHFINTSLYLGIMPPWVPWPLEMVFISGILEMALGLLLLPPASRRVAAWGIIVLLIGVFPANVQLTMNYFREDHPRRWLTILRLPLQLLLIMWAYQYTKQKGKGGS